MTLVGLPFPGASATSGTFPFLLASPTHDIVVNGTYEKTLAGKCNIYAEYRLGSTAASAPNPLFSELNMSLSFNSLCAPTLQITHAVPNTASAGNGGYWMKVWNTYGVIGVTQDMAWYWNGNIMTGKPCGYHCGLPETATHTDSPALQSDCWYAQGSRGLCWHGWVERGCITPTNPNCGERISARNEMRFSDEGSGYVYLEAFPQAWWGFPDNRATIICKTIVNGQATSVNGCAFAWVPPPS